jgi:sec-independent protein translocase protein TatC
MVLTPPDIISQFLIAIPIWLLFEAGLFFSSFFKVRKNDPDKSAASKNQSKDWTEKSHNEMMDDIEIEMNSKVIGKSEKDS